MWTGIAAIWWALWNIRNIAYLEKSTDALYCIAFLLQQWAILWEKDNAG
jgi:hypothetical protein